jgi:hypothetical protein
MRQQRDRREQTEERGRRARNRSVGPLALGLDAQVFAHFALRHFELPALNEPRRRRWEIANQLAGGAGWLHMRSMQLRQGRTPTVESRTKSIGARLLALPFRVFIKTIVWVLLKI